MENTTESVELNRKINWSIRYSILTNGHIYFGHKNYEEKKIIDTISSIIENFKIIDITKDLTLEKIKIEEPLLNEDEQIEIKYNNVIVLTHFENASYELISHLVDVFFIYLVKFNFIFY